MSQVVAVVIGAISTYGIIELKNEDRIRKQLSQGKKWKEIKYKTPIIRLNKYFGRFP